MSRKSPTGRLCAFFDVLVYQRPGLFYTCVSVYPMNMQHSDRKSPRETLNEYRVKIKNVPLTHPPPHIKYEPPHVTIAAQHKIVP